MSQSLLVRLCGLRRRDVLHAGAEQHHGAVVGADLRLPPHLPHIAGITIGVRLHGRAVGLGLGAIFIAYPVLQTILKYAGAAYLIYLAAGSRCPGRRHRGRTTGAAR